MGSLPMENTLLIGLSRQIALQRELDVVANNVANMNTTGYKADGAIFEEYLMPKAQAAGFQGADRRVSYVQDRATWRDFAAGPIRPTGNPLDVAIDPTRRALHAQRLVSDQCAGRACDHHR
jgi:flagellar basal-body rod protein FlgF